MLNKIQTARISEERKSIPKGGPNGCKGSKCSLGWAIAVLTRGTKRRCQSEGWGGRCEVADKVELM